MYNTVNQYNRGCGLTLSNNETIDSTIVVLVVVNYGPRNDVMTNESF